MPSLIARDAENWKLNSTLGGKLDKLKTQKFVCFRRFQSNMLLLLLSITIGISVLEFTYLHLYKPSMEFTCDLSPPV